MGELQSLHRAWDAWGAPAFYAVTGDVSARVQIHVTRSLSRGTLAEVKESGAAIGKADQHKSSTAQIARQRMSHCQSQADPHRRIDRVAALLQNPDTYIGRIGLLRHHHGVPGALRLPCFHRKRGQETDEECCRGDGTHNYMIIAKAGEPPDVWFCNRLDG